MSTHTETELLRLDMGLENCGCPECQAFYKTIDLSKYRSRVKTFGDVVIISPKNNKPEKQDAETSKNTVGKKQDTKGRVSKIVTGKMTPPIIMKQVLAHSSAPLCVGVTKNEAKVPKRRGPKEKVGELSRTTLWRRAKKFPAQAEKLF